MSDGRRGDAHEATGRAAVRGAAAGLESGARSYYPELDGLRAVATAMVMVFHLIQGGVPIPGPVILGQTGVDLFFVLSGFLITGILLKAAPRDWHEVRTFYIRRTLRIFPLYYAFLAVTVVLRWPVALPFWLYLQNFCFAFHWQMIGPNHFWSLAVEEQFYLAWPFVVLFLPRRHLVAILWAMLAGTLLLRVLLVHRAVEIFYFTPTRLDGLAAGALLAVLQFRGRLSHLRGWLAGVGAVSAAVLVVQGVVGHHAGMAWIQVTKFSLTAALYAAVTGLVLTTAPGPATRWLRSAPLRFVGRISYGLYVFHPPVFWIVLPLLAKQPAVVKAAAAVGTSFALALVSWYGMERHFIRLKDRLAPERARFPASAPAMTAL